METLIKKQVKPKKDLKKRPIGNKKPIAKKTPKVPSTNEVIKQITPINNAKLVEEVISHKEVKYIYPSDVVDTLTRKSWRQKVRNKLDSFEKQLFRITEKDSKEYKKIEKEYLAFKKGVLK